MHTLKTLTLTSALDPIASVEALLGWLCPLDQHQPLHADARRPPGRQRPVARPWAPKTLTIKAHRRLVHAVVMLGLLMLTVPAIRLYGRGPISAAKIGARPTNCWKESVMRLSRCNWPPAAGTSSGNSSSAASQHLKCGQSANYEEDRSCESNFHRLSRFEST